MWRHGHDFERTPDGIVVRDSIEYALPLAPLSNLALPLVRSDMRRIFDYRSRQLSRLLLPKP
jgi:ligand-binding SRPBCC domain-containing protein